MHTDMTAVTFDRLFSSPYLRCILL